MCIFRYQYRSYMSSYIWYPYHNNSSKKNRKYLRANCSFDRGNDSSEWVSVGRHPKPASSIYKIHFVCKVIPDARRKGSIPN